MTKLIAFDLDNTLLNTKKEVTPETYRTLECAANLGIEIVPVTGRVWSSVPDSVKSMKYVRYAVTLNGAEIFDVKNEHVLAKFLMPLERAEILAKVFEDLEVIYDFIAEGQGWMKKECYDKIDSVSDGEWQTKIMKSTRLPVDDFFGKLKEYDGVQKMQIYTLDNALRENLLKALPIVFPKALFTSSVPNNIEINDLNANKGTGLKFIADYLNIPVSATMAFGDGLNDIEMIRTAGIGVAMGNACKEILEAADHVTSDCDHDGVAEGIKTFCRGIDD